MVASNGLVQWEKLNDKKILITGASGMIGSYITDLLMTRNSEYGANIQVYALSRNKKKLNERFIKWKDLNLHLIEQDVTGKIEIDENVDYVIHAASNTHPREYAQRPVETITANVIGLYNICEFARKQQNCHVIILSSVEIYGENRGNIEDFDEKYCGYIDCNTLRAGYPESKRLSETLLQAYIAQYGLKGAIVRLPRVYGAGVEEDDSKAMSQFLQKACKQENIILKSDGSQYYSYCYIADACCAILKIMVDGKTGEAYNVADQLSNTTLRALADKIAEIANVKVIYQIPDKTEKAGYSAATHATLNSDKLKKTGWKADYSLDRGLQSTLQIMGLSL